MNTDITGLGDREDYSKSLGQPGKVGPMAIRQIVILILTLLFSDSETKAGVILYQFSGDLASALAEIHQARGVQVPVTRHPLSPDATLTAWQNLQFVQATGEHGLLPGLHKFLRAPKLL